MNIVEDHMLLWRCLLVNLYRLVVQSLVELCPIFCFIQIVGSSSFTYKISKENIIKCFSFKPCLSFLLYYRAYRIGQRRNVKVYRLISSGTIEENMYLRQIYKQVKLLLINMCTGSVVNQRLTSLTVEHGDTWEHITCCKGLQGGHLSLQSC